MSYSGTGFRSSASAKSPSADSHPSADAPASRGDQASPQAQSSARPQSSSGVPSQASPKPAATARPSYSSKSTYASRPARGGKPFSKKDPRSDAQKTPDPILFQAYFKSVGPRTYAAQLKRAGNGNHYLVFVEGKRDKVTDEVRKTSVYVFGEDFVSYFKMLKEMAEFVKAHPVPQEIMQKRARFWEKEKTNGNKSGPPSRDRPGQGKR